MGRVLGPLIAGLLFGAIVGAGVMTLVSGHGESDDALSASAKTGRGESPRDATRHANGPDDGPIAAPALEAQPVGAAERIATATGEDAVPADVLDPVLSAVRHAPQFEHAGDKSIRGSVSDSHGKPLGGVTIRVERQGDTTPSKPYRNTTGRDAPPPPTLEVAVRKAVEAFYERGAEYREIATGADGKYAFTELRAGRWSVSAWRKGAVFDCNGNRGATEVRPDAKVDFVAKPVVPVIVEVLLPDGKPAPAAMITLRKQGESNDRDNQGWLGSEPTITVEPGDWELRANLGDPQSGPAWPEFLMSEPGRVTVAEGHEPDKVTLKLGGKPGIRGRVSREDGEPLQYANVRLMKLDAGESLDLKKLEQDDDLQSNWAEGGEFVFRDLKPGRYAIGVCRDWGGQVIAHAEVEVGEGTVTKDLLIPAVDPSVCLVVHAHGSDGEPLSDVNFNWSAQREKNNNWNNNAYAEKKELGLWWLPLETVRFGETDALKPWPSGTRLFLIASHEKYGSTTLEVFQATRDLDVKFGPPATLYVTVPGFVGSAYEERIQLSMNRVGEGTARFGWGGGGQPSKEDGRAKIGPIEAGRYKLTMYVNDKGQRRWEQSEVATLDLTLVPGENNASLAIPTLYPLTIRVGEPPADGNLQVQLQAVAKNIGRWRWNEVPKDGNVTFNDLPPGDYRVTLTGGNTPGVMQVRVPSGPVDFVPMTVTAMRVAVNDASGQLGTAGFRDGDLITAIDGKEITSMADWQVMQQAVRIRKTVALTVDRGGEKSELTLETKYLYDPQKLGGTFEPSAR